jgi:hypothetical protein
MTVKKSTPAKKPTTVPKGKTLDDFRSAHDKNYIVPKKIKDTLAKLGDSWEYEIDFIKLAGVSTTDLVSFREQFDGHIVAVRVNGASHRKNVWAGTLAFAAKLREMAA